MGKGQGVCNMFFSYLGLLHKHRTKKQNKKNKNIFSSSISLRTRTNKKRTFYTLSGRYLRASLTVEAAMVIPVFIFAFWVMLYGIRITQLQSKIQYALNVTAEQMGTYADIKSNLAASGLFLANLKGCEADVSFVSGNWAGFRFGKSKIQKDNKIIYLQADYKIKLPQLLGTRITAPCVQSVYSRAFFGKSLQKMNSEKIVYITTGQTVYHTSIKCSYLNLSIQKISEGELKKQENNYLKRYTACSICKKKECFGYVYITRDGTRYHNTLACKSLKRTIERILLEEVDNRRLCSRCGKE